MSLQADVQIRFADKVKSLEEKVNALYLRVNSLETEKEVLAYQVSNLEELVDRSEHYDRK